MGIARRQTWREYFGATARKYSLYLPISAVAAYFICLVHFWRFKDPFGTTILGFGATVFVMFIAAFWFVSVIGWVVCFLVDAVTPQKSGDGEGDAPHQ
jgi:hypothetical protein